MKASHLDRRQFLVSASISPLASGAGPRGPSRTAHRTGASKLAILGGEPIRHKKPWPAWPHRDERVLDSIVETTRSGKWCRIQSGAHSVPDFEKRWAETLGAAVCVATGSGTQALHTCVEALGIGPGDEVITSPYTDPGTIAAVLSARALPVLADLDRESYQLDPDDVERRITENTRAIMPVHMMGQPCQLDRIMELARQHKIRVIEDACQGHLSTYGGKKLGTIGDLGCFSFQSSKTLACGEGGAIVGDDEELMDRCYTVHNHGTSRRGRTETIGPKYRMNEFEAAVLLGQLAGLRDRFTRRNENAAYLTSRIKDIPGLRPQKLYEGTESGSFYIYAMTYQKQYFNDADRSQFLKAIAAEGVELGGYIKRGLHREPWVDHILLQKVYQKMFSARRLREYREQNVCPDCDQVCREIVILWASGPLLGDKQDMDDIATALQKVYENRDQLRRV